MVGCLDYGVGGDELLGLIQEATYEVVELLLRPQVGVPLVQLLFVDVLDPCPDRLLGVERTRVWGLEDDLEVLSHLRHIICCLMSSVIVQHEDRTS